MKELLIKLNTARTRLILKVLLAIIVATLLYAWNISNYVSGFSVSEVSSVTLSQNLGLDSVINAPYHVLQYLSLLIFGASGIGVRLPSVLIGLLCIGVFFALMRQITNQRIAIFSSIMFGSASWMLHIGRLGDPTVTTALWPIAALLIAYNVYKYNLKPYWYLIAGLVLGLAAYTPRMIYFVAIAIIVAVVVFQRYETKMHKTGALAGIVTFALVLSPLVAGLILHPEQISEFLALPQSIPSVTDIASNFTNSLSTLVWESDYVSYLNLADLPLLDIVTVTFSLLGLLVIFTDIRAPRGWLILSMLASSLVIVSVFPVEFTNVYFLLPIISILSGIGLFTLWTRWREIFPNNSSARGFALVALSVVVLFSVSYNFERYYLAWSRVPETDSAFSESINENVIIN